MYLLVLRSLTAIKREQVWLSDEIRFMWDVIIRPCCNFNGCLLIYICIIDIINYIADITSYDVAHVALEHTLISEFPTFVKCQEYRYECA